MPFLVDQKDIDGAIQTASQRPFEGVDPGFIERLKADYSATVGAKNVDAREATRADIQREYIRNFYQVTGQRLPNWMGGPGVNADPAREAIARKQVEQWKMENPGVDLPDLPTQDEVEQEWIKRGKAALQQSEKLSNRTTSSLSSVGGFLGSIVGSVTDPINMLTAPFGASASTGLLRTALVEGAIGAGSDAVGQAVNLPSRQQADPNYGVGSALEDIASAGAGGAALGAGFKTLAGIWHRARTGEWPSHVRDVANVVTREAAVPDSRFEKSMPGDNAHRAALQKSLDDIINGRPVELPQEVFVQQNVRPGRVYDADGRSVGVKYEVVDASDIITSNRDDLTINPDFPQELQPRDRTRALSQDQIAGIASNLQPERLGFSNDAGSGAPVVGPDGLVESGNGRVLALRRAFQQDGPQAQSYRNFLRSQNFDIDGIQNPVLIARRVTDLEDRVGFVTAANRSTAMKMGAAEQAIADGRLIDGPMLDRLEGGDVRAAGNAAFTQDFMSKLPRAEQGSLIDKDGFLSQEGERRVTAALMGRAYGEPTLLGRTLEDTDNNIKAIGGALADASGPWAKMRDAVARGEIPAGMDVTQDLLDAVGLVMRARDEGRTVSDLVNQAEMFGGPGELAKIMARAMFTDADLKRPVGRARLAAFLKDFADEAMKNDAGPRLFGDALEAPDILKSSLERVGRNDLLRVAEDRLTPEATEKLALDPQTAEASIMDGERLAADTEEAVNRQARWERESARLLNAKSGEIPNALYHRDVGPIDVIWGEYDPAHPNKGAGLSKIAQKHPEVLENLPTILQRMEVTQRSENRIRLSSPNHRAVVRLDLDGEKKTWLMTAFEYDENRRAGKTTDRSGSSQVDGHSSSTSSAPQNIADPLRPSKPAPVMVDLGDGQGERDLADILREADEEIAAGKEIEACTIGSATE